MLSLGSLTSCVLRGAVLVAWYGTCAAVTEALMVKDEKECSQQLLHERIQQVPTVLSLSSLSSCVLRDAMLVPWYGTCRRSSSL